MVGQSLMNLSSLERKKNLQLATVHRYDKLPFLTALTTDNNIILLSVVTLSVYVQNSLVIKSPKTLSKNISTSDSCFDVRLYRYRIGLHQYSLTMMF